MSSNLIFTPILKLFNLPLQKVRSHTKAKGSDFHIINIWLHLQNRYSNNCIKSSDHELSHMLLYIVIQLYCFFVCLFVDRNKQAKS